jgi:hypothetical protein
MSFSFTKIRIGGENRFCLGVRGSWFICGRGEEMWEQAWKDEYSANIMHPCKWKNGLLKFPGMGKGKTKENGERGEFKYDIL